MTNPATADALLQPQSEAPPSTEENEATTPVLESEAEAFLEIKFNKELIKLDRERTKSLAQKGMKYDRICEEYERLKSRESENAPDGIGRVYEEFPEISSADMLPKEVREAAQKNNTDLLYEYLLFEHRKQRAAEDEVKNREFAASASTGSLSADDRQDPTAAEFLRGVWGR